MAFRGTLIDPPSLVPGAPPAAKSRRRGNLTHSRVSGNASCVQSMWDGRGVAAVEVEVEEGRVGCGAIIAKA